jgi:hypothetical protein
MPQLILFIPTRCASASSTPTKVVKIMATKVTENKLQAAGQVLILVFTCELQDRPGKSFVASTR